MVDFVIQRLVSIFRTIFHSIGVKYILCTQKKRNINVKWFNNCSLSFEKLNNIIVLHFIITLSILKLQFNFILYLIFFARYSNVCKAMFYLAIRKIQNIFNMKIYDQCSKNYYNKNDWYKWIYIIDIDVNIISIQLTTSWHYYFVLVYL